MSGEGANGGVPTGRTAKAVFLMVVLAAALLALEVLGPRSAGAVGNIEELHDHEPDRDFRTGSVSATAAQRGAVSDLGATARWNQFGTPRSLIRYDGFLAKDVQGDDARAAARAFLANNAAVFGLSADYLRDDARLKFENETPMEGSDGHVVLFRQQFGDLPAVTDGSVLVGLTGSGGSWDVAYVSSSLSKNTGLATTSTGLTGKEAWVTAARDVGESVVPADIESATADRLKDGDGLRSDFTQLRVDGLSQEQQVRLTAVPTPEGGVRPAYEAILIEDSGNEAKSFTSFVDANTGKVLVRTNNVQQLAEDTGIEYAQVEPPAVPEPPNSQPFQGTFSATSCDEAPQNGPFTVAEGTGQVAVSANATNPANDIVLQLVFGGVVVAEGDVITTPESILYEPEGGVPPGDYFVRVCSFQNAAPLPPNTYTGFFLANDAADPPDGVPYPPEWDQFFANPPIGATIGSYPSTDTRDVICWNTLVYGDAAPAGCALDVANQASRAPWDVNTKAAGNPPTFTTIGNNARSAESWYGPFSPGPTGFRPTSATREYEYPWTNAWYESTNPADPGKGCSPTELAVPGEGNDISAATAALFATHNRIHDWSYNLGFTEQAYNLQDNNFGLTPPERENDPEIGDVQAGAVNGGAPSYLGRDNANQITLNDGIAPITNMYLWQPIAGAFYAPCVDGDYDVSVIAHEYGHAIQNRMVAGPDQGLSGLQARSMGESWSDLTAIEYLYEYGYNPTDGENRYAVGPYVTGDKQSGIRNYGMNASPLNYSDIEYDPNGVTSPHADGEIWSAVNFDIRELLMNKYDAQYPSGSGTDLQKRCADGETSALDCPGNRRWAQIFHDAFLLQQSSVSFLDARDAYLAADRMRFGGANQKELWLGFARGGMGIGAKSEGSDDRDPTPSFASPRENNAEVTFRAVGPTGAEITNFEVFVGRYEARAVPVADGRTTTPLTRSATIAPGSYDLFVRAPGFGLQRARQTFASGDTGTRTIQMQANLASSARGARPTATSDGTAGTGGASATRLLDETEATNWRANGPVRGKQVTVNLAGGAQLVDRVQVSALLRPQEEGDKFGDTDTQSRFSALRQFRILTCTASASNDCSNPTRGFTGVFTSPASAETGPASAGQPRPTAPDLQLAGFDVRDTTATHVQLRVISNQCTGAAIYQGDPDADPANDSDCTRGSDEDEVVRAAELQVFSR
ncbi:peptidase M36 [Rubrobacter tropicus]|uniref:Peptidase M36 n=1 Tax=Rubrobacter tropicus TaxID=2653851 RepID=A0A6G8Q830_9ACTN|nr:M36 family metallopeptidase [Rubrobacter tropicus]QIN82644.1 peptidase M36 [Rubrobacter tropicus]